MATDDLHQLIHSLSQAEKRYFKVFAGRHVIGEENNYVRLFDAIHAQQEYSEEKLRNQFRGEKFITRLPYEKNYLFKLILKSLRSFQAEKSPEQEVDELLAGAQILIEKGLWERGLRMTARARELAGEHHLFHLQLKALLLERRQIKMRVTRELEPRLQENAAERAAVLQQLANYFQYADRYDQLFYLVRREFNLRDATDRKLLEELEGDEWLQNEITALTPPAKQQYWLIRAFMSQLKGDFQSAHQFYAQHLALWETSKGMRAADPQGWRVALANYLGSCTLVNDVEAMPPLLEKMKAPPFTSPEEEREAMSNFYFYQMLWRMAAGNWTEAWADRKRTAEWLEQEAEALPVSRLLSFWGNLALVALVNHDFSEGLQWTDRILDHDKLDHRADVQLFARLMQMMMHFELGNHDLMEPLARSSSRAMKNRNAWHPFEQKLTARLKAIPELPEKKRPEAWLQLQQELITMERDEKENLPQGFTEVKNWVQAKVQATSKS